MKRRIFLASLAAGSLGMAVALFAGPPKLHILKTRLRIDIGQDVEGNYTYRGFWDGEPVE